MHCVKLSPIIISGYLIVDFCFLSSLKMSYILQIGDSICITGRIITLGNFSLSNYKDCFKGVSTNAGQDLGGGGEGKERKIYKCQMLNCEMSRLQVSVFCNFVPQAFSLPPGESLAPNRSTLWHVSIEKLYFNDEIWKHALLYVCANLSRIPTLETVNMSIIHNGSIGLCVLQAAVLPLR